MKYLHHEFDAGPDDLIEVLIDGEANVMLLDPINFERYGKGLPFRYRGGLANSSPVQLTPPTRAIGTSRSISVAVLGRSGRVSGSLEAP